MDISPKDRAFLELVDRAAQEYHDEGLRADDHVWADRACLGAAVRLVLSEVEKAHAQAAIAAHLKAMEEAGYVVVPREPTEEMVAWAKMAEVGSVWEADFGKGKNEGVTWPIGVALMDTGIRDIDKALIDAYQQMIKAALGEQPPQITAMIQRAKGDKP